MESAKPSELLFLKKPPSLKLLIHLPRLIICICGDIHRNSLPDILLDLFSVVARRVTFVMNFFFFLFEGVPYSTQKL